MSEVSIEPGAAGADLTDQAQANRADVASFRVKRLFLERHPLNRLPFLTTALVLAIGSVFYAELVFAIGPVGKGLSPSPMTLYAFGGLDRALVSDGTQAYRLLTYFFTHGSVLHLALNAFVLCVSCALLERILGWAWTGALLVASCLGGAALSLMFNAPHVVAVGASGGIMGLLSAELVLATRFHASRIRRKLVAYPVQVLVLSLLPHGSNAKEAVDLASHFGGAIVGAVSAALLLATWDRRDIRPPYPKVARLVCIAALAVLAWGAIATCSLYPTMRFVAGIAPQTEVTSAFRNVTDSEAANLASRYPKDPRVLLIYGQALFRQARYAEAIRQAETAQRMIVGHEKLLSPLLPDALAKLLADARNPPVFSDILGSALSKNVPGMSQPLASKLAQDYAQAKPSKALAVTPSGKWFWWWSSTASGLEEVVLERCQIMFQTPCATVAVDDRLAEGFAKGEIQVIDAPRVSYAGKFDPAMIPGIYEAVRRRPDVQGYLDGIGWKATALNTRGVFSVATGFADQASADQAALDRCNADEASRKRGVSCILYSEGPDVTLRSGKVKPEAR